MTLRLSMSATRRELSRPTGNAKQHWAARAAQIVTLEDDRGLLGRGELAPLPGFSPDTLEHCKQALTSLDPSTLPERSEGGEAAVSALGRASAALPSTLPAARAALEGALLDLWSRAAGLPAWAFLSGSNDVPKPRSVAALLMGKPEAVLAQGRAARVRGLFTFKLKIGGEGAFDRELQAITELRAEIGSGAALRLDVNRAWSGEHAAKHLRELARFSPEFVEEPCSLRDLRGLPPSGVPFALDESLPEIGLAGAIPDELRAWGVRALILKPTLLGGISACVAWSRIAEQCGARTILSHAFEGPLGLALSATLALSIGSESAAHGLDPEGAHLDHLSLPFFSGAHIHAWSGPGLGELELRA